MEESDYAYARWEDARNSLLHEVNIADQLIRKARSHQQAAQALDPNDDAAEIVQKHQKAEARAAEARSHVENGSASYLRALAQIAEDCRVAAEDLHAASLNDWDQHHRPEDCYLETPEGAECTRNHDLEARQDAAETAWEIERDLNG